MLTVTRNLTFRCLQLHAAGWQGNMLTGLMLLHPEANMYKKTLCGWDRSSSQGFTPLWVSCGTGCLLHSTYSYQPGGSSCKMSPQLILFPSSQRKKATLRAPCQKRRRPVAGVSTDEVALLGRQMLPLLRLHQGSVLLAFLLFARNSPHLNTQMGIPMVGEYEHNPPSSVPSWKSQGLAKA